MKKRAVEILDHTKLYDYKGSVSKLLGLTVEVKLPGLKLVIYALSKHIMVKKKLQK